MTKFLKPPRDSLGMFGKVVPGTRPGGIVRPNVIQ